MGVIMGNVAQSFGVQATSASVGTILSSTIPLFIVIFAAVRLKQSVAGIQWFGLVVAFVGIALVSTGGQVAARDTVNQTSPSGVFWMLASAVAIAFYYIWSAELTAKYGTLPVVAWNNLVGLFAITPLSILELNHTGAKIEIQSLWTVIYLGATVTVAGILLWLYLLRVLPARVAASVQYLQPVIGIAASALLFGDVLGLPFFAGSLLILSGLGLAVAERRKDTGSIQKEI